jgi:uncharacterized membrane protein YgdD (TMEM256/DUF423 family)
MKHPLLLPSIFGFTGVALGAFGAHGLQPLLESNGTAAVWLTAVQYHFYHTLAMLALTLLAGTLSAPSRWALGFWAVGVLIFSGTLYALAITNLRWLGAITPIGGTLLLAGWVALIFVRRKPETT